MCVCYTRTVYIYTHTHKHRYIYIIHTHIIYTENFKSFSTFKVLLFYFLTSIVFMKSQSGAISLFAVYSLPHNPFQRLLFSLYLWCSVVLPPICLCAILFLCFCIYLDLKVTKFRHIGGCSISFGENSHLSSPQIFILHHPVSLLPL